MKFVLNYTMRKSIREDAYYYRIPMIRFLGVVLWFSPENHMIRLVQAIRGAKL